MNGTGERKIEVFAPFGAALDLTKLVLFQPFDIAKWLTIGFAAFLANLAGGGYRFSYNDRVNRGDWHWSFRSTANDFGLESGGAMPGWLIPLLLIGGLVVLAIVLVLLWVGARGKFIFADCIVRNRGAIVEPWREFRREGNSYFLFILTVGLLVLGTLTAISLPLWIPLVRGSTPLEGAPFILSLAVLVFVGVALFLTVKLVTNFMVPIMYRRRCGAIEGCQAAFGMIAAEPGPVILYLLFVIVLVIAFAIVGCVITCLTCCIAMIPYVGTVILLPAYVFFMSYLLLFVRQFGPEFDPWANIVAAAPATEPIAPAALPADSPPSPSPDPTPPTEPPAPPPVQT